MKIAVVGGAGRVGATTLFQLVLEGIADELAVVDVVTDRAQGEMLDMLHGTHLSHRITFSGPGYEACDGADFVIITAGIPRKPDETRLDLLKKNVDNLRDNVLPTLSKHAGNAFIIMVANPADVLTYQAAVHGAFPSERVIGTGTLLDSTRLRSLLADRLKVDPRQVYAYMLGEHGDSQYPYLSGASVAGIPLAQFPGYSKAMIDEVVNATRFGGAEVIKLKGGTFYAVAPMIVELVKAIRDDAHQVLPVSTLLDGEVLDMKKVALSLPCVIGRRGRLKVVPPPLSEDEKSGLLKSYNVLREALESVGL
ncbi:MAG: lactate dehydrogenase [Chloroflexi bacterium]|nr:lactate dehydrogenase [Chloroflexota bacterium]MBV9599457.1 lactate dehydrogenase [Chloroflexota bacterium]